MLNQISLAAAGFSIVSLILLAIQNRAESRAASRFAYILLFVLISIQLLQVLFSAGILPITGLLALIYLLLLGLVGPVFYLYSQCVIHSARCVQLRDSLHFFPAIILAFTGWVFEKYFNLIYSGVFLLGGVYMGCLAINLYQLRQRRNLFKMEFIVTAAFLSWALAVVIVGLMSLQAFAVLLPAQIIMLALAVAGALYIQLNYPHLLSSLEEMASTRYQTSTLSNIDCDEVKKHLHTLVNDKKIYEDSELSLSILADMLGVKPHQLSEILNTQLGMGFSTYLRSQRVMAAERMLKAEPEVSVLAIGLSVGFSSQSAFYAAFKEIHRMAPGQYRRQL